MSNKLSNKMIKNAMMAVLTIGIASTASVGVACQDKTKVASNNETEKCYGIAKIGQNDCGTASNDCSGVAKINGDKNAWMMVPKGLCNKIVGGIIKKETIKS